MNTKKWIIAGLTAALMGTGGAYAQSTAEAPTVRIIVSSQDIMDTEAVRDLVKSLASEGFTYIEVGRTFLGRANIKAYDGTQVREIVMNASTGEIMRDMMKEHNGMPGADHMNGDNHGEGNMDGEGHGEGNMGGEGHGEGTMGNHGGDMSGEGSMGGSLPAGMTPPTGMGGN